jgi:chloramphenicol-sensitive protein RarD
MTATDHQRQDGLPLAVGAYLIWGLLPLYLRLVNSVPPTEFVGWRIVFTVPVCLAIVSLRRQWPDVIAALRNPKALAALLASAVLIGGNWLIYVFAIQSGHVLAASLGYYINPLFNVLIGTFFLGERLGWRQWLAVAVAALGVAILAWGARDMLLISVSLAVSFGLYGLVRKLAPVGSLPGLTVETALLWLPAALWLVWLGSGPQQIHFGHDAAVSLLVALSGVVTAVPLLLFALAARRMDYSALGFVQYIAPTIVFITGIAIFDEPLRPVQLASFVLIWIAIAVFSWDLIAQRRAASAEHQLVPATEEIRRVNREPV